MLNSDSAAIFSFSDCSVIGAGGVVGVDVVGAGVVTVGVVVGDVSCGLSEIHKENIIKIVINAQILIDDIEMEKIKRFL